MVTKTRIQVQGLRELGEALREMQTDMALKTARAATSAAARLIRDQARRLAPVAPEAYEIEGLTVQPGNLPKNIVVKRVTKSALTSEHVVAARGKRRYGYASRIGALQEFGTVHAEAQPFMRPAYEQEKGFAVQKIRDTLKRRIDKANAKTPKGRK